MDSREEENRLFTFLTGQCLHVKQDCYSLTTAINNVHLFLNTVPFPASYN
jgi:hypothetical protein